MNVLLKGKGKGKGKGKAVCAFSLTENAIKAYGWTACTAPHIPDICTKWK
jgi:hypothetical protein